MTKPVGNEQLKPCPFCGKPPLTEGSGENRRGLMIECVTPNCVGPHVSYYDHQSALKAWNTRASAPVQAPDAARFRVECKLCNHDPRATFNQETGRCAAIMGSTDTPCGCECGFASAPVGAIEVVKRLRDDWQRAAALCEPTFDLERDLQLSKVVAANEIIKELESLAPSVPTQSVTPDAMRDVITAMKSAVGEIEWLHSRAGITSGDCGAIRLLRTSIAALSTSEGE